MSKKRILILVGVLIVVLGFSGLGLAIYHYASLPERVNGMETIVLGQSSYVPGSQAALRVVVRNMNDQTPLPNASVEVALQPQAGGRAIPLFEGITDAAGSVDVSLLIPEDIDPAQNLVIKTKSEFGQDSLEQPVTIDRDYKILLTTDKPLYQPGQVIHIRALALSTFDLVPAAANSIEFIIADGKGNKVFRKSLETSDFGVASIDFQLATEVNTGPYKITAQMGNTNSEKTVTVERYVLPKFDLTWSTDQSFYMPGDHVSGTLNAQYFFGKDISGGEVVLEGFVFDFERQDVFSIQGQTDENGDFSFEFNLPDYIVASDLDKGIGRFYLEASITDQAKHTEQSSFSLPVAQSQIIIEAIPESGLIRPGVENILYILTSYPDGTPAQTQLNLRFDDQQSTSVETGAYGLAEVRLVPGNAWLGVTITARDATGASAQESFNFEGSWESETVLLRPDRAVYEVGDTMHLDMFTSVQSGRAYLDIVREGQTVSTRTVSISESRGEVAVDIGPDLFGTLELHAYKILSRGGIVRDTRIVVVDAPSDLMLNIDPDQEEYLPGQTASIDFQIQGSDGLGIQSVLGLAIVDEAVFALAEQDPGFAKLYFMLEAELLQPKYDIHGFSISDMLGTAPQESDLQTALEGAAKASMASAAMSSSPFSFHLDSHEVKAENARLRQAGFFSGLTNFLFGIVLMIPVVIAVLAVVGLSRQRTLSTSLAIVFGLLLGLVLLFFLIPSPEWVGSGILDRLSYVLDSLSNIAGETALIAFAAGILGFIGLVVYAIRKRDWTLGLSQVLTIILIPLLVLLAFSGSLSDISPHDSVLIWALIAFLLLPLSYFLRAAGFAVKRQYGWAILAFAVFPFVLIAPITLTMVAGSSGAIHGDVMMRGEAQGPLPLADFAFMGAAVEEVDMEKVINEAEPQAASVAGEPPRLRQYFPETMYWEPEAITDEQGHLSLEIPMADSITTWRLTALASTQDGRLGATTAGIRVFQDFFIELDLPLALTQDDEISLPVGIFNYLPDSQDVRLVLEPADWFELLDEAEKEITIAGNDIDVVYFRIKAVDFGRKAVKVTAYGSRMSDAIQKEVTVYPNGKQIHFSWSDRIPEEGLNRVVNLPDATIPGTQKFLVKIYPGVVSQVVEGLEGILRMPNGCFEQTTSATYPNVLVLDYLETTGQASPEAQFQAEEYINLGYQRLMTFEVSGGGFSLFGDQPADRMLTAYGLQEFSEMARVYNIDMNIIERAAEWLLNQQSGDGSWENDRGLVHEDTWSKLENDRVPVTAYIAWSLIEAGYGDDSRTQSGLDYIKEQFSRADDPYVVALVANALAADDRENNHKSDFTENVLDQLAESAKYDGDAAYWTSDIATFMGSQGQTGSIETTALAAYAFLRADSHPELSNAALTYLVRQKDNFGTWHSTQATILSLKALIETVRSGAEKVDAQVTVKLNDGQTHSISVTPETFDVVQWVSFDDINPGRENVVSIDVDGKGNLMYQISGSYYLPWEDVITNPDLFKQEMVTIDLKYDRTELTVDDTVQVDVKVTLNKEGRAEWVLVDLGIPPGFQVKVEDLNALVARFEDVPEDYAYPTVERYELTGRQVLVYVGNLTHEHPLEFSYRLQAKFPLVAQTPASNAYDYYNPDVNGEQVPIEIVVVEGD
jgi:uncharacterized protein YfaS (alpha-2-macroglobulin family)